MAGASLFALLDDIATVLDDVAVLTKVAAKKTSGVLGDDLALNAEQVSGVRAERELPVVWAVAKGSFRNKLILVPLALLISQLAPMLVTPLLMIGGAYLCFEGFEKVAHKFLHSAEEDAAHHAELTHALTHPEVDLMALEQDKIKGAIRTDFILSAEIIVIALGTVADKALATQFAVLAGIAILMTVGVYGLVAGIVKLDDGGLYLVQRQGSSGLAKLQRAVGGLMLGGAPYLMKGLALAGTVAMFLVGGGILAHGLPGSHDLQHGVQQALAAIPMLGGMLGSLSEMLFNGLVGLLAGGVLVLLLTIWNKLKPKRQPS
ncbi:DUF808 domain-containing protein [Parachitinimonas caeni]|uniref:DUF808 domain-containing protein n=1 Tax=Parachitinimonas caeni TaxID=3031301 RepID=A0ABT7DZ57_9NEIS|nr:DUF808 domain-containing protein [Parachitinimonas caeni]MDK2125343.1 DUF808 domain-containing protein [Parachitinimonas caeni]